MTTKSTIVAAALSLATLGVASAKSYDVMLSSPAKAGQTELRAGEYKLKIEGSEAVFTDVQHSKTFRVPVKVETEGKKFDSTVLETTKSGDMDSIQAIDLGGSPLKLEFGK